MAAGIRLQLKLLASNFLLISPFRRKEWKIIWGVWIILLTPPIIISPTTEKALLLLQGFTGLAMTSFIIRRPALRLLLLIPLIAFTAGSILLFWGSAVTWQQYSERPFTAVLQRLLEPGISASGTREWLVFAPKEADEIRISFNTRLLEGQLG